MTTVQENARELADTLEAVRNHPMCLEFQDHAADYTVIFPNGDFPVNAIRVSKGMGKIKALRLALDRMESIWRESYP